MKNTHMEQTLALQPNDRLATVLAKLTAGSRAIQLDISNLKELRLEDFQALRNWQRKDLLSLRCTDQRLRALLCRLRLHKLYQVWGAAA